MNDLEPWGDLEGSDPDLTRERVERMRRRLLAAIAEHDRRRARRRTVARAVGGALAAACLAAAVSLGVRAAGSSGLDVTVSRRVAPEAAEGVTGRLAGSAESTDARRPPRAPRR